MLDRDHVEEIDRVLRGQDTGRDPLVTDSWLRCVETYGMDPARADPAHIVTDGELREHREQSERLIATARSGLQGLFRQVAGRITCCCWRMQKASASISSAIPGSRTNCARPGCILGRTGRKALLAPAVLGPAS